jgi:signal transduction histidine kinase
LEPPVAKAVGTAIRGAERAATLTHRLLAFSRHHETTPAAADLNRIVSGLLDLVGRTLGSHIAIVTDLANDPWPVRIDENQFENALLNLAINARDAMPNGGTLTIATANTTLDEAFAEPEIELQPGSYVMLSVTDTGSGMSPEIIRRMFEPFFTTKGDGGTGLGLGMVYGFVKQAEGHVQVTSEPGTGTSVTLYLPRHAEP